MAGEDEERHKKVTDALYSDAMEQVYDQLRDAGLLKSMAPPEYERAINMQEIETCLCKYHSYYHGHYKGG